MSRRKKNAAAAAFSAIGTALAVTLILGGLVVVGYFLLMALAMGSYGSNK